MSSVRPATIDRVRGYGFALAAVVLGVILRWELPGVFDAAPFLIFYPAVMLAAIVGGNGPGIFTTLTSAACVAVLFDSMPGWRHLGDPVALTRLGVFLIGGIGTSVAAGSIRASRAHARQQAEALRRSEKRLCVFFESGMVGTIYWNMGGEITDANDKFLQMVGYSREDLAAGRVDWTKMSPPEYRELDEHALEDLRTRGVDTPYEKEYIRKDGTRIPIIIGAAMLDEQRYEGVAFVLDITERKRAEEAQSRLAAIVEFSEDAILSKGLDGTILSWNGGAQRMFGYRAEEMIGNPITMVVPPDRLSEEEEILARLGQGERIEHYETVRMAKDGRRMDVLVTISPLKGQDGRIIGASTIVHDITERKQADQALRESEQRYRSFVEATAQVIWRTNAAGMVDMAVPAWQQYTGQSFEEVAGFGWMNAIRPEDRSRVTEAWRRASERRSIYEVEYLLRRHDGVWRNIRARGVPVKESDGTVREYIGTCIDITDRKRAEEQVRLQAAALRAAANGIAITDARGKILWVNPALCDLTGYSADELIGRDPRMLKSGRQGDAFYREMWETIRRGEVWHGELTNRRKDGSEYVEEMTISPLRNSEGAITHFIAVKQDVSWRRAEQEALATAKRSAEQAKHAAEEANRAKDQFLAVLSHELRTPLTPVVTALSMLQEGVGDEQNARETLEMVRRNVEMEARLIDDLLDVTRIVRGKIELDRKPTPLGEIIRRAIEVCQQDIEMRQIHFGADIDTCAQYIVNADATRLQQVFWNLLKNAVKFTPHAGRIGVRCHCDGGYVITQVIDSGEGIEPKLLPHIFNPFEQGGARVTRQFGGLGLGLTITKGVVEMHGGTIEAYSEGKGKGATFTVRLPLCTASETEAVRGTPAETVAPGSAAAPAPAPGQRLRILLVEDHGDTAKVMRRLLSGRGYEVETAGDVATALELIEREPFDLLLSDLGLPDGSGMDLMRKLREHGRMVPGIALSGYGQEEDVRRSKEAGFAAHLTKPTNPDVLTRTIGAVIRGGRRA